MNNSLKDRLYLTVIATLIVFAISTLWFVASYSRAAEPTSFRSFQVSGEGSVVTIPDIAQFSFGVITQGGINLGITQEENTKEMNAILAFLVNQEIEKKDISTKSYQVNPRYQYYSCNRENGPCPPPEIVGYTVEQTVQIKIRDFSVIGDLLTGVVSRGANNVSQLSFRVDDPTKIQNEARKEAVEKAKGKAQSLAEAGGFKVGRLLSIQEGFASSPRYDFVTLESASKGTPSPSIEPGSQEVKVSVTLTYEIK